VTSCICTADYNNQDDGSVFFPQQRDAPGMFAHKTISVLVRCHHFFKIKKSELLRVPARPAVGPRSLGAPKRLKGCPESEEFDGPGMMVFRDKSRPENACRTVAWPRRPVSSARPALHGARERPVVQKPRSEECFYCASKYQI
jgi:hypothetical protein